MSAKRLTRVEGEICRNLAYCHHRTFKPASLIVRGEETAKSDRQKIRKMVREGVLEVSVRTPDCYRLTAVGRALYKAWRGR